VAKWAPLPTVMECMSKKKGHTFFRELKDRLRLEV